MKPLPYLCCAATALLSAAAAQEQVAIKAGRVITVAGAELRDAVVLIENGKIKQIGKDVEVPWNATVIDASDKVVMPTWVLAHTSGGVSGGNEQMANVPFLTVQDAIDPSSSFFEEALRNGVGCVHAIPGHETLVGGQGMIVRPYGKTVEDMTVRTTGALKLSLGSRGTSRIAAIRQLRRVFEDAIEHRADLERRKKEFEQEKEAGATDKAEFDDEPDEAKKPIIDLLEKKLLAHLYVPSAAEVGEVARLKEEHGIEPVLVLGEHCHRAAAALKALGLPIVLDADAIEVTEQDPDTEEERRVNQAQVLHEAGIVFALSVSTSTSAAERYPWWQLASAIRGGVDRDTAIRALTVVPATMLGLGDELGTLEAGKIANVQILTGDPLQATSWVDTVLLEGEVVYERDKDRRLQHLFGENDGGDER